MNYRSLLVHLDSHPKSRQSVNTAIRMARQLDCHLLGLAPTGMLTLPAVPESALAAGEISALAWDALHAQAQCASEAFAKACTAAKLPSFETLIDVADPAESVVRHAHCCDLAILGQADPESQWSHASREMVEQVVLHSAKPTLVLPHLGNFEDLGARVIVAWDDSREATRAIADALPLLQRAELVLVFNWNEPGSVLERRPRLGALQQWLRRHGVNIAIHEAGINGNVAEALLSQAEDRGADLVVMGAYGHSRWRERILGGATEGVLQTMNLPVLMSR